MNKEAIEAITKAREAATCNPWFYEPYRTARMKLFMSERAKAVKTLKRELKKEGSLPECLGSSKDIIFNEYTAENNPRIGIRQWVTKELAVTIPLKKDFHSLVLRFPTEGNPNDQIYPQTNTIIVRVEVYGQVGGEVLSIPCFAKEYRLGNPCLPSWEIGEALNYVFGRPANIKAVEKYVDRLDKEI